MSASVTIPQLRSGDRKKRGKKRQKEREGGGGWSVYYVQTPSPRFFDNNKKLGGYLSLKYNLPEEQLFRINEN